MADKSQFGGVPVEEGSRFGGVPVTDTPAAPPVATKASLPIPKELQGPPDSVPMRALKALPQSAVDFAHHITSLPMGGASDIIDPKNPPDLNPIHGLQRFVSGFNPKESFANDPVGTVQAATAPIGFLRGGIKALPSTERAGQNFNAVASKIGPDTPVDVSRTYPAITRAQELAETGSKPPQVMTQFRDRVNTPGAGPITYRESRDFASNAGNLAAGEKIGTNKMMGAQVKQLAKALDEGNEALADQHGVGDQYRSAMREYRRAQQIRNIADFAKEHSGKMALGALGLGGAYPIYKKLRGE